MRLFVAFLLIILLSFPAAAVIQEPRVVDAMVDTTLEVALHGVSLEVPPDEFHPYRYLTGDVSQGSGLFTVHTGAMRFNRPGLYLLRLDDGLAWIRVAPGPYQVDLSYQTEPGETVETLFVAGSFTDWDKDKIAMIRDAERKEWRVNLQLRRGRYPFKIVKNGNWIPHPLLPRQPDSFGGENSLLLVGEPLQNLQAIPVMRKPDNKKDGMPMLEYRFRSTDGRDLHGVLLAGGQCFQGRKTETTGEICFQLPPVRNAEWRVACLHDENLSLASPIAWYEQPAELKTADPGDGVMYFLVVDRFVNGMPENDGPVRDSRLNPLTDWQGGDLAGVIRTLEDGYFERLGVNWLWLSPLHPQPLGLEQEGVPPGHWFTSYHGYWPLSLTGIDARFGDEKKLRKLIDLAGERGIGLLLDMVFNHVHESAPLFKEHPDWFTRFEMEDGSANLRKFDAHPYTTWFDRFLPAFDFARPEVVDFLAGQGADLLTGFGFSGFRLDAVKHIPPEFFKALKIRTAERYKRFRFIGETLSGRADVARYLGPEMLDGQFDFPLYLDIISTLATEKNDLTVLGASIEASAREYPGSAVMVNFLGNHDFPRFLAYADGDIPEDSDGRELAWATTAVRVDDPRSFEKLRLAFGLLFALRGIPLIYYGDELGMTGGNDPDNRRMFRGFANWNTQEVDLHNRVTALAGLRQKNPVLSRGATSVIAASSESLTILRSSFDQQMLVVISRNQDRELNIHLPDLLRAGDLVDLETRERFVVQNNGVTLPMKNMSIRFLRVQRLNQLKEKGGSMIRKKSLESGFAGLIPDLVPGNPDLVTHLDIEYAGDDGTPCSLDSDRRQPAWYYRMLTPQSPSADQDLAIRQGGRDLSHQGPGLTRLFENETGILQIRIPQGWIPEPILIRNWQEKALEGLRFTRANGEEVDLLHPCHVAYQLGMLSAEPSHYLYLHGFSPRAREWFQEGGTLQIIDRWR